MKKLQNDFTTPEQSKRLLELGVPEWTANWKLSKLVKDSHGQKPKDKHDWVVNRKDYTHMIVGFMKYDYLPCWSVGRLIEIFDICYQREPEECITEHWILTQEAVENFGSYIEYLVQTFSVQKKFLDFSKLEE